MLAETEASPNVRLRYRIVARHYRELEEREEQADIPIYVMPNGDTAGSRGAAIEALKLARSSGLA